MKLRTHYVLGLSACAIGVAIFVLLLQASEFEVIPTPEPEPLTKEQLVGILIDKEVTEEAILAAAKQGLAEVPYDVRALLPEGFDEEFLKRWKAEIPRLKDYSKQLYLDIYTLEELGILRQINQENPWMKVKGLEVIQKITRYTGKMGEKIGAAVGEDLDPEERVGTPEKVSTPEPGAGMLTPPARIRAETPLPEM